MANFVVRGCNPSPRIDVVVASPDSGIALHSTEYRGLLDVSVDTNQGPTQTEGSFQVFVPDSLPYPRADLTSEACAACTVVPVGHTPLVADVRAIVDTATASFVDDPTQPGVAWLQLTVGLRALQLL